MANREKISIFTCEVKTNIGEAQKGLLFVTIPQGYKSWQHVVVTTGEAEGAKCVIQLIAPANDVLDSKTWNTFFQNYNLVTLDQGIKNEDITITSKIDELLINNFDFDSCPLEEDDYLSNNNTLLNYLNNHFKMAPGIESRVFKATSRKIAFPKANINWDETWNSPYLTDEEKASITQTIDLDIIMANENRDCRKEVEKVLNTNYYNKNFTCIGLHGNPGGGKTKMVLNDICAVNHIPAVAIPCDPMMSINQILAQVGPVNKGATVGRKELEGTINSLKNRLTLLQQNPSPTEDEEKEIKEVLKALNDISNISKECADLVKTPSILMKCLKYNLPLVVFLDEANCASTQFQNSLAPIISDGMYKDGPEVGKNKGTIKWILAWNPNTSNTKSFDGKFYDRINFIQVEDISSEERIAYRTRRTIAGMFGGNADYTEADKVLKKAKLGEEETNKISEKVHQINASSEALKWYTKKEIEKVSGGKSKAFPKGEFETAYLNEVTLASQQAVADTIKDIDNLVEEINEKLYKLTKGRDTKNPDRNSFFYISDRNLDIFTDYIFSYSDVRKGIHRFIYDLIPGGNTVKTSANNDDSTEDKTSTFIADSICDYFQSKIDILNKKFFTDIPESEKNGALIKFKDIEFDPTKWKSEEEDSDSGDSAVTPQQSDDKLNDDLDSCCG